MAKKLKAFELLEKYGWIQGNYGDRKQGFCFVGAVSEATQHLKMSSTRYFEAIDLAEQLIKQRYHGSKHITNFNDAKKRTKRQVVGILKTIAKWLGV